MSPPRIDQINVVVADVGAAARFLAGLGVELPDVPQEWGPHHRSVPADAAFEIDLDSSTFAREWGGLASDFGGVVLDVRVDERSEVDRLHDVALAIGGQSRKAPYDAFWGARFAVVEGPGPIVVGLMSRSEDERRTPPPDPRSLT